MSLHPLEGGKYGGSFDVRMDYKSTECWMKGCGIRNASIDQWMRIQGIRSNLGQGVLICRDVEEDDE